MKMTFNDVIYRYLRSNKTKLDGYCKGPHLEEEKRLIVVHKSLVGKKELEINIHEMLHACLFDLADEEWIKNRGRELGDALWRLGYRKNDEEKDNQ